MNFKQLKNAWQRVKISKSSLLLVAVVVLLAFLALHHANTCLAAQGKEKPLKIGFILVGPVNDWGWNYAHEQGRKFMESVMGKQIETTVAENIPESAEVERVMEKMIAAGTKLIFATSYGYLEPAYRVAARHPDIVIMHCGRPGVKPVKNIGTYFFNHWEPMYVVGMVAGRMTKKNKIGYVAAHPVPPLLSSLNAYALGARSVNPKVKIHVVWTNSWCDPAVEAEAAKGLIDAGADVLAVHADSPITVVQTAERHGLFSTGYHADVHHLASRGWLTGARWDWGNLYVKMAKSVINHTWEPGNIRFGMVGLKDGTAAISSFGQAVPKSVQQEALALKKRIESGKFVVFQGPVKDREGKLRIPEGQKPSNEILEKMDWVVAGVKGTVPKK